MSDDLEIFIKSEQKADALQDKDGLNMTLRDLYACENNIPYEIVTDVEAFLNVERPEIYHIYEMRMKDRNKQTDGDEIW